MINRPMYLVDLVSLEQLQIMAVPPELSFEPQSAFSVIRSPGRNDPFSHFSGSEDTLKLELDWYSVDPGKFDVLLKCRWVQSFVKADGYEAAPRLVKIIIGDIFPPGIKWQVIEASYKLTQLDAAQEMRPIQAYQNIVLRRYSDNNRRIYQIRNGY